MTEEKRGKIVVIGGSGIADSPILEGAKWKEFDTEIRTQGHNGVIYYQEQEDLIFIPTHGHAGKIYGPRQANYGAIVVTAKKKGTLAFATSAVGCLDENIKVGSLVTPRGFIDDSGRNDDLYGIGFVEHVNLRPAVCEALRQILFEEALPYRKTKENPQGVFEEVYPDAVYTTIPGNRFGTAEEGIVRAFNTKLTGRPGIVGMTSGTLLSMAAQVGLPIAFATFPVDNDFDANHDGGTKEVMRRLSVPEGVPSYISKVVIRARSLLDDPPSLEKQLKGNIIPGALSMIENRYLREIAEGLVEKYCSHK